MKPLLMAIVSSMLLAASVSAEVTVVEFGPVSTTLSGIEIVFTVKSTRAPGAAKSFTAAVTEAQLAAQIGTSGQEKTATELLSLIVSSRKAQFADFFRTGDIVIIRGPSIQVRTMP